MREVHFGRPLIGEEEKKAVIDVLESPILVHGPKSKEFESNFAHWTKSPYAISVSSCTAGLHLSYFYLGLKPGDEVIVPAQTHTATVHAVEFVGATPIFVDAEKETGNIDILQIESKITKRTRAISVVHFLGMPVDMYKINDIAKKYDLFVVEDCALAIGSYFKGVHVGMHGDVGCYSFYPVKHMTTAEGGMMITKHKEVSEKVRFQKAFGVDRQVGERKIPGQYDVKQLGFNYRLNEMQCALGVEQLKRMAGFLKKRKENFDHLYKTISNIEEIELFRSSYGDFQSSYYCLSFILKEALVEKRVDIINKLKAVGVGTSIYYPQPVPMFSYYKEKYNHKIEEFPMAARISYGSIALPVGPHLGIDDMDYISNNLKNVIKEVL